MFIIRRAGARALSLSVTPSTFAIQPRCMTTFSTGILRSTRPAVVRPFLKGFSSSSVQERESLSSEKSIEDSAIEAAEQSADQPLRPETTSAAEFDASDVQPIQAREIPQDEVIETENTPQGTSKNGFEWRDEFPPNKALYIGNLFFDVTEEDLRREFSRFGTILDVKIAKDPVGMSRGHAFVTFLDQTDAQSAKEEMHGQQFEGRRLLVSYRRPQTAEQIARVRLSKRQPQNSPPSRTIYIGNLSFDLSDQDLSKLFSSVKNVLDVRVAIDRRTGQPRGFAHADFVDIESAEIACQKLDGQEVFGRTLRCNFSAPSSRVREKTELP